MGTDVVIKPGQMWQPTDIRDAHIRLEIISVREDKVLVMNHRTEKSYWIQKDRFGQDNKRSYRLL